VTTTATATSTNVQVFSDELVTVCRRVYNGAQVELSEQLHVLLYPRQTDGLSSATK